ncbi:MAG: hypothetical protein HY330_06600 [Chloroflexi bacterium]|nr:hypothetical protein [Chloroflexota bacterium]
MLKEKAGRGWLLVLLAALGVAALAAGGVAGCARAPSPQAARPAREVAWPEYVRQGQPLVQETYRFALAHPEVLQYMPCSCGCVGSGHKSNLDCFIKDSRSASGGVVFDPHAAG